MTLPPTLIAVGIPVILFFIFWALGYWLGGGVGRTLQGGVKRLSAWLGKSRLRHWKIGSGGPIGSYVPMFLVLLAGVIAALGAAFVFVSLAEQLRLETSVVNVADQAIRTWFGLERVPPVTFLFIAATTIGGTAGLAVIVVIMVAILLLHKERASAVFVVVTVVTGALINLGLKMIFARARPDLAMALAAARWFSFPSGHAMNSFITFGAITFVALRQAWPWIVKSAALAAAMTMVVLVGLSRVYLGVHWASDIAGAWSAGTLWLACSVMTFEMLLRQRRRARANC